MKIGLILLFTVVLAACSVQAVGWIPVFDSQGFDGYNTGVSIDGQGAGYWSNYATGAKVWTQKAGDPEFDIYHEVVYFDGTRGNVLKFNAAESMWQSGLNLSVGLQGANDQYWGEDQSIKIEFKFIIDAGAQGFVDGALTTNRNAHQVTQSKIFVGNDAGSGRIAQEMRVSPVSDITWPSQTIANFTNNDWHTFKIIQTNVWGETLGSTQIYLNEVLLGTYYTHWSGWAGWMDDILFDYAVTGTGAMYIDDMTVSIIPEPATIALLGAGVLGLIRRKK